VPYTHAARELMLKVQSAAGQRCTMPNGSSTHEFIVFQFLVASLQGVAIKAVAAWQQLHRSQDLGTFICIRVAAVLRRKPMAQLSGRTVAAASRRAPERQDRPVALCHTCEHARVGVTPPTVHMQSVHSVLAGVTINGAISSIRPCMPEASWCGCGSGVRQVSDLTRHTNGVLPCMPV
jgi:hypothetical protein